MAMITISVDVGDVDVDDIHAIVLTRDELDIITTLLGHTSGDGAVVNSAMALYQRLIDKGGKYSRQIFDCDLKTIPLK